MITWLQFGIVMPLPMVILSVMAALPTKMFNGHLIGGGPVREWFLNNFFHPLLSLPVWPADAAGELVAWFSNATPGQEWLLAFVAALNFNALLLLPLFFVGEGVIKVSSWIAKKDIELKHNAVR